MNIVISHRSMWLQILWGLGGLLILIGLAVALSRNRRAIDWKTVMTGVALQLALGVVILWTTPGRFFFQWGTDALNNLMAFSEQGSIMVFGEGFREHYFAFAVLPAIIFISSLMSVLFYYGIMQKIVEIMAKGMVRIMNVSGAEALSTCADVFVGQTEAPLVIKPYIKSMTRSEIMAMMTGGMATISGGTMIAYVGFGADPGHLLASSLMAAPASLVVAKIIVPETQESVTKGKVAIDIKIPDANGLDAACRGASEGLMLALNVGAMIIAFVSLTALLNAVLGAFPPIYGAPLSFERILGWAFSGVALAIGVEPKDCMSIGVLLGKKMFLNEFIAYMDLRSLRDTISERSFVLATYALCGFANFSSIAIQIGGTGGLVPERREDLARLGILAMLGGTIATLMTATVAGILIPR